MRPMIFSLLAVASFCLASLSLQAKEPDKSKASQQNLSAWLLPDPSFPSDNPFSEAKSELGKVLFFDPRLSPSRKISCASCHNPGLGWADGVDLSVIAGRHAMPRHTPSLINVVYRKHLFWDGRGTSLEAAITEHLQSVYGSQNEMIEEVAEISDYRQRFREVFKETEHISKETISAALATYLRTIIQRDTPFDRWARGDRSAISKTAQRGFVLFTGKALCVSCHQPPAFSDGKFHPSRMNTIDPGRFEITHKPDDRNAFCTPPLRQVSMTAPYMHAGQKPSLASVIQFYNGNPEHQIDKPVHPSLGLNKQEIKDLTSFLESLAGPMPPVSIPMLPVNSK